MMDEVRVEDEVIIKKEEAVTISPPDIRTAEFIIEGRAPLVIHAFSEKAQKQMRAKQEAGSTAQSKRKRDPRDFAADLQRALHVSTEGWNGINAMAFKHALVSACRTVSFKMTLAKLGLFVEPEGFERSTGLPLIQIHSKNGYEESIMHAPNTGGGFDLRVRPMWREWRMTIRISYDADMFTLSDVANLLMRAGRQVGVGEGRPDSKKSVGQSWGTFEVTKTLGVIENDEAGDRAGTEQDRGKARRARNPRTNRRSSNAKKAPTARAVRVGQQPRWSPMEAETSQSNASRHRMDAQGQRKDKNPGFHVAAKRSWDERISSDVRSIGRPSDDFRARSRRSETGRSDISPRELAEIVAVIIRNGALDRYFGNRGRRHA